MAQQGAALRKFNILVTRHRGKALATLAVLATVGILASQAFPGVQDVLINKGVFAVLTLLILIDVARAESNGSQSRTTSVAVNQDEALPILVAAVPSCKKEKIDLLEYAGATTLPLIRAIQREGASVRLLMKHPETVQGLQKQRMVTTLDTLFNSIFDGYGGSFEAKCYRQPYSLRARKFGNSLLELGWLTPDYRRDTAYGHANPSVVVTSFTSDTKHLFDFFDRTFEDLWMAPDTEDAATVLQRMQANP